MSGPWRDWVMEPPGWQFDLKASVSVQKLIQLREAIHGSSLESWEDGLLWRFSREGPHSLFGLFLLAPEGAGLVRLHVTYLRGQEKMAPKQAEGMRALAELAHTYNLFIDRPVSCLWLLDNAIACKFRSLAASAVQRRVAGKDWIRNPRVIACHKALEHFQLANYCELTCKLCGLEGFWGSLDMAEHLASNGHELQRWYLTLAEGKKASPLPAEAALARQWLELGMQKWPKNDGTLFHVNHLDFHVDVKVPDLAEAYQPANAAQSVFEC
ncbi:unnamed protein product [Durusdinium trenchii]|uniref:Uncharacterized protein n=1 Tax=Durusdinium trenchii TaxID=1381693 RepID=A0ABP0R0S9_9DINO